ncbi:uncharacterized protein [Pseudorasbora parva]|uniref:uncharacterized protein n=1 Tax=Pseudorasbora parva TaxID=51549 RepID=UPI00351F5B8B
MPYHLWRVRLSCPVCGKQLTGYGAHKRARQVLDVDRYYLMITETLWCSSAGCKTSYISTSKTILDQLDLAHRMEFRLILTQKYACDMRVIRFLRERTLGNSPSRLVRQIRENHSEEWLKRVCRYLGVCSEFAAKPSLLPVKFHDPPKPVDIPSHRWMLAVYGRDILSRLDHIKASITSTFGNILKMDSTKKVNIFVARGAWFSEVCSGREGHGTSGEAQAAAQHLPVANLLDYDDLKRAILQRVGRTPEQHRQRFRSLEWGESGRPFALAQQLRDECRRWLLAGGSDVDHVVDLVVLEQFITRLPRKTAEWVQCHRPTSLETAINLAEDHLVACPGVGAPPLTSPSLSPPSLSLSRPVPLPRSRPPGPPRVPPRGRGGMGLGPSGSSRVPPRGAGPLGTGSDYGSGSAPYPRSASNPLPAAGAAGRPGLACWRCGDPDHFVDRCPMMDIGTMIRIPDVQRTTPDQAGEYQIP